MSPNAQQRGGEVVRSANQAWLDALARTQRIGEEPTRTLPLVVEELAEAFTDAPALISAGAALSHRQLAQAANRYSRWALDQGIGIGDCVCLLMPNRPEYAAIWLGISRIGGIVALLNTSLRGAALTHSIGVVRPRHVIVDGTLLAACEAVIDETAPGIRYWSVAGEGARFQRLEPLLSAYADGRLGSAERRPVTTAHRALYIYTSGTTGLPKAANVSHHRLMLWSHWFAGMMDVRPSDRMYNCLPMYHSIGGVVAVGAVLVGGGSVLLRERFSANQFWGDVVAHDCTLFQYIGELCRYLVNTAPDANETRHRLRLACGNGLRADVWEQFERRFKIPQILEFYAATENNFSLFNCDGRPGAIGKIPAFLTHRFNVALVKLDADGLEPLREESGLCIRCAPGEAGEAIGEIRAGGQHTASQFEGYTDAAASQRKVIRDVFVKGDAWLRTGDVMRKDAKGYFYFIDRIGDTFRWKGENVATCEVADAIAAFPAIIEATVYGVTVPGTEGRAGMATIVTGEGFDLAEFRDHLAARLPSYARPVFLRIGAALEVTATFKHKKPELARQGFDPKAITDAIYFDDHQRETYVRLDRALFHAIQARQVRL
jgi:fatty-acyl-CoA synthase